MKAIINGFRYDTDKAVCIGSASADCSTTDFQWWKSSLYRTPRAGRYFLAGRGGPMTMFSRPCGGNMTTGGEGIRVLNENDAREWAERYLTVEEVESGFTVEEA